ncbi:MAG: hypothetical protein ACRCV0_01855 [Brevinema sp.]
MKRFIVMCLTFLVVSCGSGGKKTTEDTSSSTPNIQESLPTLKDSKILSKLRNTSWEMPDYKFANISFKKDKVNVSLSETSYMSNAGLFILEEDNDIVVFNVYTDTNNSVFALSIEDPKSIKISVINESNSIEAYKQIHNTFGTVMVKK